MKTTKSILFGLFFLLLSGGSVPLLSAAEELQGSGVLQAVESGELIVIDEKGFLVDSYLRVFDGEDKETMLYRLGVPTLVSYSYRYTTRGVVISRIQEVPQ